MLCSEEVCHIQANLRTVTIDGDKSAAANTMLLVHVDLQCTVIGMLRSNR